MGEEVDYKIGEYVLVDLPRNDGIYREPNTEPYWICKIEEIQKNNTTAEVQIKVKLFYRRRNVEERLLVVADKYTDSFLHKEEFKWELAEDATYKPDYVQLHYKLLQRNLFVSKDNLVVSPQDVRGKCSVFLLTIVDSPMEVLRNENTFFFLLGFDAVKQEVHEDKGSIMIGPSYQATIPPYSPDAAVEEETDKLLWEPEKCTAKMYSNLTAITKSLQTLRSMSNNSNPKAKTPFQIVRDAHMMSSMERLHECNYDLRETTAAIVRHTAPVDIVDSWNRDETEIFERALYKHNKQFRTIRQEFLPWKSQASIVEYYYRWKATYRYKPWKLQSCNGDLKDITITHHTRGYPSVTGSEPVRAKCEGCDKVPVTEQWCSWGPPLNKERVCQQCYSYWIRYAGFPDSSRLERIKWEVPVPPHLASLKDAEALICPTCAQTCKSRAALRKHVLLQHTDSGALFIANRGTIAGRCRALTRRIARNPCRHLPN